MVVDLQLKLFKQALAFCMCFNICSISVCAFACCVFFGIYSLAFLYSKHFPFYACAFTLVYVLAFAVFSY